MAAAGFFVTVLQKTANSAGACSVAMTKAGIAKAVANVAWVATVKVVARPDIFGGPAPGLLPREIGEI